MAGGGQQAADMPLLLATLSSLTFGVSDFVGAMAARRESAVTVVVGAHATGLVALLAAAPLFGEGVPAVTDLGWGALGGVAGSIGLALFYRALATTRMGVTAPVAALVGTAVPVMFGVAIGERPAALAWLGAAIAVPAMLLMSRRHSTTDVSSMRALVLGTAVGLCFGLFGILISRTGSASGIWPLIAARAASVGVMSVVAMSANRPLAAARQSWLLVASAGLLDTCANVLFLLAVRVELLSLVAVIMSLYPVGTVGLARLVLKERVSQVQGAGMALAVGAVALIVTA